MARQVYAFNVTVATGSTPATAVKTKLALPNLVVDQVRVRIPPGPCGQVGFALAISSQQIIPYQSGTWVVANDERITWDLDDFPTSGAWELWAYNTGHYPHTLELVFALSQLAATAVIPPPLPLASLSSP